MTARVFTELTCDHPGCKRRWPFKRPFDGTHDSLRRVAGSKGWTYNWFKGDFCPDHGVEGDGHA